MVKFSKQFEGQLIPEWKEAFVDYWQLKKDLKKLHLFNNTNNTPNTSTSLPKYIFSSLRNYSPFGHQHREHGPIQVIYLSPKTQETKFFYIHVFIWFIHEFFFSFFWSFSGP